MPGIPENRIEIRSVRDGVTIDAFAFQMVRDTWDCWATWEGKVLDRRQCADGPNEPYSTFGSMIDDAVLSVKAAAAEESA